MNNMHICVLPSWYPNKSNFAGIFFADQAKALSLHTDIRISLINWGPNEFVLKFRKFYCIPLVVFRYLLSKKQKQQINEQLVEYIIPHLTWTSYLFKGNYGSLVPRIMRLISLIEQERGKVDLIHAHVTFPAGYLAMRIRKMVGIPFIITEHSGPFPFKEFLHGSRAKRLITIPIQQASCLIAVSNWMAVSLRKFSNKIPIIIPNSLNTDFFVPSDKNFKDRKIPVCFTLSHLTEEKGIADLIRAIWIVSKSGKDFLIRIGGYGVSENKFKSLAQDLKVSNKIIWLGRMNRESALVEYQSCDFYVMPSRLESFSMVIVEALACGKPVIATACGGPQDLINPLNGRLSEPNNPKSLAAEIILMIEKHKTFESEAIRNDCLRRFSDSVVTTQLRELYRQMIFNECVDD